MEIKGIEVSGDIYDIEDETARTNAESATQTANTAKNTADSAASDLSNLNFRVAGIATQTNAIEAVVGDLDTPLDTQAQTLIGAVNEIASATPPVIKTFHQDVNMGGNYGTLSALRIADAVIVKLQIDDNTWTARDYVFTVSGWSEFLSGLAVTLSGIVSVRDPTVTSNGAFAIGYANLFANGQCSVSITQSTTDDTGLWIDFGVTVQSQ